MFIGKLRLNYYNKDVSSTNSSLCFGNAKGGILMITEQRYARILDELQARGTITVLELKDLLDASESTIRRDLRNLDDMGMLKKVHGGAVLLDAEYISVEDTVFDREQKNVEEKKRIGEYAASLVNDDDFVYLDAGTSTGWMIEYLKETKATFVTNGIAHGQKLIRKNIKTYILGGKIKTTTEAVVGAEAVEHMRRYNFTKSFLGTNGVQLDAGYTTVDMEEALLKQEAIRKSYAHMILADYSKFDKVTAVTFGGLKDACIITDRLRNDKYVDRTVIKEVWRL